MTYKEFRSLVLNRYGSLSTDDKIVLATRYQAMHPEFKGSLKEKLKEELSQINPMEFKTFASGFVGHGRENSIAKNSLIYDLAYNYLTPEERLKIKDGSTDFNANPFQDLNDDDFYRNLTWGTDRFKFDPNTQEAYLDGGNTFNWAYDMLDYGLNPNSVEDRKKYIGWMKEAQTRWNNQENSNPRNFTWSGEYNPQYRENGNHPIEWLSDNLIEGQWGNTQKNLANGKPEFANSDLVGVGLDIATTPMQMGKMPIKALGYALDMANPFIREGVDTYYDDDKNIDTYVNKLGDMFTESTIRGAGNFAGGVFGNGVGEVANKTDSKLLKNLDEAIQFEKSKGDYDVFRKELEKDFNKQSKKPMVLDKDGDLPLDAVYVETSPFGSKEVKVVESAKDGSLARRPKEGYSFENVSEGNVNAPYDYVVRNDKIDDLSKMNTFLKQKGEKEMLGQELDELNKLKGQYPSFGKLYDYSTLENPFLPLVHVALSPVTKSVNSGISRMVAYSSNQNELEPSAMKPEELTTIASNIRNTKPEAYDNYLRYGYVGNLSDYEIKVLKEYALKTKSAAPLSQPNKSWDAYSVFN